MIGFTGIEKVIYSEIPSNSTIMIIGDTGTLKTTVALETIKAKLNNVPEKVALFFTLKEEIPELVRRFSLKPYVDEGRLILKDYDFISEKVTPKLMQENAFKGISEILRDFREKYREKLALIAIDPMNLLLSYVKPENLRRYLYHFFSYMADLKTQNWVIFEKIDDEREAEAALPCYFLADGIIEFGLTETQNDVIRFMEIKKLRGVNHNLKRFQITYKNEELKVLGPTYEY